MLRVFESASAAARLTRAHQFMGDVPTATEVLVVASTRASADDFVREVALRRGATAGPHRFSLFQLANRIALPEMATRSMVPISAIGADAIAARAAFEVRIRQELEYFDQLAERPRFSKALAATIRELRAFGVGVSDLARLGNRGGDLGRLLAEYDRHREDAGLADITEVFEIAGAAIESRSHTLIGKPVLLLDLPIHSQAELRFVARLLVKAPQALATVAEGDERTSAALGTIQREHSVDARRFSNSLERLQNFLFLPTPAESYGEDNGVQFFSAPGEGRECIEIARRIHDEARRGMPFDRIAIVIRSPETYAVLLEAALERASVPAYFARGSRRPDPTGRAFLALLQCAEESLSAKRFAEYLSLAQVPDLEGGAPPDRREVWVPPNSEIVAESISNSVTIESTAARPPEREEESDPLAAGALRAPWKWEELLVEAAVIGGKERWERRLVGLAAELGIRIGVLRGEEPESPRIALIERQLRDLDHLRRFALPVIALLDDLPQHAVWGEWLDALEALAPRVLRFPERVLSILAELRPLSAVGPVTLTEVRESLSTHLLELHIEPPRNRFGRVFVGLPEDLRGRSFAVVFVPGLAERLFPQKLHEDPLLPDEYRNQLQKSGPSLLTRSDRGFLERLRLQIAAGAAESRIWFSYPRVEVALGRPRVPSFYALDVRRTTLGHLPNVDSFEREAAHSGGAELAWMAPRDPDRAIDEIEYDLAVLRPLLSADPKSVRGQGRYLLELSPELGRSLRTRWMRWRSGWSAADGICSTDSTTRDALSRYRLTNRAHSPTSLQNFAICPYKFALASIYRLESREEVTPLQVLDPLTKGSMYHAVVAQFMRQALEKSTLPLQPGNLQHAQKQCDAILDEVAAEYHELLVPAIERVWKGEVEGLRADLRGWLTYLADHPDGFAPQLIEYSFGLPIDPDRDPERPGTGSARGGFLLHGIVDLVETNSQSGTVRVTDYKTGRNRTEERMTVGGGEVLQPVLYSLAIQALRGHAVDQGTLFFSTAAGAYERRTVILNETARKAGFETLHIIDQAVEQGFLAPAPREKVCNWCDFRAVCGPHEELRTRRKDPAPLSPLLRLRSLP